jgi:hypothetical protein
MVVILATTGLIMGVTGGGILIVYRVLGISSNKELMPLYMAMLGCSCAGYAVMRNLNANGRTMTILRRFKARRA